ncbi:hypothetical protein [Brevundimonas sp.]|uniref:hypothetical protein n=1 Tax=Brevundimonas sp. TaxID=1871086 RepID=UPI00391B0CA4
MIAILLAIGVAALSFRDAIPLRAVLTEGSRFGVSIGDPYDDAHETLLSNGYSLFASEAGGLCIHRRFDATRTLHKFDASGWPPGTVCLVEEDGIVVEIIWAFELMNGFL